MDERICSKCKMRIFKDEWYLKEYSKDGEVVGYIHDNCPYSDEVLALLGEETNE